MVGLYLNDLSGSSEPCSDECPTKTPETLKHGQICRDLYKDCFHRHVYEYNCCPVACSTRFCCVLCCSILSSHSDVIGLAQVDSRYSTLRSRLPSWENRGLLLRWASSLANMEAVKSIPKKRLNAFVGRSEMTLKQVILFVPADVRVLLICRPFGEP